MTPQEKRDEIIEMAENCHRSLKRHLAEEGKPELLQEGGNLLLGCYYAESPTIYFGLNPGSYEDNMDFVADFDCRSGRNPPFCSSDDYCRGPKGAYGRNWRRFLADNPHLYNWFNDGVTSTFLCPWRTPGGKKLKDLNTATGGRLYAHAEKLIRKMIEHHEATLLIVASKGGLYLLNEILCFGWNRSAVDNPVEGSGGIYQWRKRKRDADRFTVLQIPHFSYAVSREKLAPFAQWLTAELRPFGLNA